MFKPPTRTTLLTVAIPALACEPPNPGSSAADGPHGVTIRDSAGIEIVENHAPEHPGGSFWTIDPEPEIVLGGAGEPGGEVNDPSHLVWRVAGLARLADGRVAVLSSGSRQLMLFEPSGRLSRIIGGPGEGPGEFTHPLRLQYLPPDTLVVWDQFLSSVAYFDAGGTLLRERPVDLARLGEHGPLAESLRLPLPDGSFLVGLPVTTDGESGDDCARLAVGGLSVSLRGSPFRQENLTVPGEKLLRIDDAYAAHSFGCAKGFGTHLAVGGDPPSVYVSNDDQEIRQRSLDGALVRIIRRTTEPPPVTDRAWEAEEEHRASLGGSSATEEGPEIRRREKYDAIESLLVGADGYLWVREWSSSQSGIPDQWSVFSPQGRWLGSLPFPPDPAAPDLQMCGPHSTPCRVGKDYFLVVRQDELERERVEGYRIRRGPTTRRAPR